MKKQKVAVGLSGGVDSATSAALLVKAGYDVTGVFLECWRAPGCPVEQDRKDALDVSLKLGIPFKVLDFKKHYHDTVVDYFYSEYKAGRTPNPDTMCNKEIKFGLFYDWAMKHGFDYVATGHYARIFSRNGLRVTSNDNPKPETRNSELFLARGMDPKKDQSYFLYQLRANQLPHILFPIGHLTKKQVRSIAEKIKLPVAVKPDSQGICFIGPVNTKEFLKERIKPKKGSVLNSEGVQIGTHSGAWYFTIGQRGGWQIDPGYQKLFTGKIKPLYIVDKNVNNNTIIVGHKKEILRDNFSIKSPHWIDKSYKLQVTSDKKLKVRIRHQGQLVPVKSFTRLRNTKYDIQTAKKIFAVAPGQVAVIYQGQTILGGGIIS
jgi:tRNA-specific 2-thiouridylase